MIHKHLDLNDHFTARIKNDGMELQCEVFYSVEPNRLVLLESGMLDDPTDAGELAEQLIERAREKVNSLSVAVDCLLEIIEKEHDSRYRQSALKKADRYGFKIDFELVYNNSSSSVILEIVTETFQEIKISVYSKNQRHIQTISHVINIDNVDEYDYSGLLDDTCEKLQKIDERNTKIRESIESQLDL